MWAKFIGRLYHYSPVQLIKKVWYQIYVCLDLQVLKQELVDVNVILTFRKTLLLTIWTISYGLYSAALNDPANKYMFKVNNKNTRKWCV